MLQFEIEKIVAMANLNTAPEREGQNYVPAADIKIAGDFTPEEVKPLFGNTQFSVPSFRKTFWDKEGSPLADHRLVLSTKFKESRVTLMDASESRDILFTSNSATLSAFQMDLQHGFKCVLTFNIRAHLTPEEVGLVYNKPKQMAFLKITDGNIAEAKPEKQGEMDLDDAEDGDD